MLGVMHLCVGGLVFMCWGSCIYVLRACINVLGVMHLSVGGLVLMCWGSCIYVLGACINVLGSCIYVLVGMY